MYDESFHEWEIIPLTSIKNTFRKCSIFHSNLDFNVSLKFPEFYIKTYIHGKTLFLFSHLIQAISDLGFYGLIKILKLTANHFILMISRNRILILLNTYASRLELLKARVKPNYCVCWNEVTKQIMFTFQPLAWLIWKIHQILFICIVFYSPF